MTQGLTKKLFSNVTNNHFYEVWSDDVACCDDDVHADDRWVVYSYANSSVPQFTRRKSDFDREFKPLEVNEEHLKLMRFYDVSSLEALVDIQAKHIEQLQAQSPPPPRYNRRVPREG
jgi:hypothetical protein